jgi:hypothetical protein
VTGAPPFDAIGRMRRLVAALGAGELPIEDDRKWLAARWQACEQRGSGEPLQLGLPKAWEVDIRRRRDEALAAAAECYGPERDAAAITTTETILRKKVSCQSSRPRSWPRPGGTSGACSSCKLCSPGGGCLARRNSFAQFFQKLSPENDSAFGFPGHAAKITLQRRISPRGSRMSSQREIKRVLAEATPWHAWEIDAHARRLASADVLPKGRLTAALVPAHAAALFLSLACVENPSDAAAATAEWAALKGTGGAFDGATLLTALGDLFGDRRSELQLRQLTFDRWATEATIEIEEHDGTLSVTTFANRPRSKELALARNLLVVDWKLIRIIAATLSEDDDTGEIVGPAPEIRPLLVHRP